VPISVTAPPVTVDPAVPTAAAAPTSWVMPNLVGVNLQDAQNRIQSLTTYAIAITTSHDATGAGRQQIVDRNWKVCSQNVPPGQRIRADTKIDFGAVKTTERC
jgi:beta-lactam-binding protein with PASTA domain